MGINLAQTQLKEAIMPKKNSLFPEIDLEREFFVLKRDHCKKLTLLADRVLEARKKETSGVARRELNRLFLSMRIEYTREAEEMEALSEKTTVLRAVS